MGSSNFERFLYAFFVAHAIKYMKTVWDLTKRKHACLEAGTDRRRPSETRDEKKSFFTNKDGLWIYHTRWLPPKKVKGVVILLHGLGEHIGRYHEFAEKLREENYAVYGLDHQGHGQSEGDRVHIQNGFEDYMSDIFQFIEMVRAQYLKGNVMPPFFLMGHSMGGNLAVRVASDTAQRLNFRWDGVVLSAPAIRADPAAAGPVLIAVARVVKGIFPKLGLDSFDTDMVCRNKAVVQHYKSDPLIYQGAIRSSVGVGFLDSFDIIETKCLPAFDLPFLMCIGSMDRMVLVSACIDFHNNAPSQDKELKVYDGFFHELLKEDDGGRVEKDIITFLNAHIIV